MSHSIQSQLLHAFSECVAIGQSKRSYVHAHGSADYKTFSVRYSKDVRATAIELADYCKEHGIRWVRDIDPGTLQDFLRHKSESCKPEVVDKYISHVKKIEQMCRHTYGRIDWHTDRLVNPLQAAKTATKYTATDKDYDALLGYMRRPGATSEAWKSLVLSRHAGLRISETANVRVGRVDPRGGVYGYGTITLQGAQDGAKGGRWRVVSILSPEALKSLLEAFNGLREGDFAIHSTKGGPMQAGSLNKALKRAIKGTGLDYEAWRDSGHHAFRRAFAQECWDVVRQSGGTKAEARAFVNQQLGHGKQRRDDDIRYVGNRW